MDRTDGMTDRRDILQCLMGLPFATLRPALAVDWSPLRIQAKRAGLFYGTAVSGALLKSDSEYASLVGREAGILVAEGETKRSAVQQVEGTFNFGGADAILDFARKNQQMMRGHTLVWHRSNPAWLAARLQQTKDERLLTDFISASVKRFQGVFHSWDVVNEAVDIASPNADALRTDSIWYAAFGNSYIETAFRCARDADKTVPLYYNEANLEGDVWWAEKRRIATLNLLESLIAKNVPINGLGIQGHLKAFSLKFNEEVFSRFLDKVSALGLKIIITELDVADIHGPSDPSTRDQMVADLTRRYLDVAFSKKAMIGCLTWGISDKYSWLSDDKNYRWPDGQRSRGLPYDEYFRAKPMRDAIAKAIENRAI